MRSILNEAFEWLDRAEQAREVAGQLTDPKRLIENLPKEIELTDPFGLWPDS